ncbi:MAG: EF-hand domain-containing protein [Vampirovibrionales bacterium]|nr:EF-hand domain-containing protein [Vampirovibrionales bacterium]
MPIRPKIIIADCFQIKTKDLDGDGKFDVSHGGMVKIAFMKQLKENGIEPDQVDIVEIEMDTDGDGYATLEESVAQHQKILDQVKKGGVFCVSSSMGFVTNKKKMKAISDSKEARYLMQEENCYIGEIARLCPYFQALDNDNRKTWEKQVKDVYTVGNPITGEKNPRLLMDNSLTLTTTIDGLDFDYNGTTDVVIPGFSPKKTGEKNELTGNSFATPFAAGDAVARYIQSDGKASPWICADPMASDYSPWNMPNRPSYQAQKNAKDTGVPLKKEKKAEEKQRRTSG